MTVPRTYSLFVLGPARRPRHGRHLPRRRLDVPFGDTLTGRQDEQATVTA
ncbi:hypothetical protein [Streptomyces sp. enrichment culture]